MQVQVVNRNHRNHNSNRTKETNKKKRVAQRTIQTQQREIDNTVNKLPAISTNQTNISNGSVVGLN